MTNKTFKIFFITISLIIGLFTFGCRKGENDPLISLRSRKARITGGWNLSSGMYSYQSPGIYDIKIEYDGEIAEEFISGVKKNSYDYKVNFIINKDYTYERIINENGYDRTEKGNWFFTKKSKQLELKNKEAIILSISSVTSSGTTTYYTGASSDEMLMIDRLKNDEVVFKSEKTYTSSVTDTEKYEFTYLKI
ncbi:hypothetical protein N9544_00150 [Flavobacteriales bacterium]|nr:hypothetical protein [Flavobacteriales bacterium]